MKKSEIRLIIVGIASLVISVILAVITVVVFITNYTMSGQFEKITNGIDNIRNTVESAVDDITDVNVELDMDEIQTNIEALERITT